MFHIKDFLKTRDEYYLKHHRKGQSIINALQKHSEYYFTFVNGTDADIFYISDSTFDLCGITCSQVDKFLRLLNLPYKESMAIISDWPTRK